MPSWKTDFKGFETFKNNQVTVASGREQNKGEVCELRGNLIMERSNEHKMVTTGQEGRTGSMFVNPAFPRHTAH